MRLVILGQQDFGRATLEAFLARGDEVAGVFVAPDKGRPDPLRTAAEAHGVPVFQFPRLTGPEATEAMQGLHADLGIMAYVTQFVPQALADIPRLGTIQFHPSLLPAHRGASAMSWAIISGRRETGFSVFRPTEGLDEGPVILTRAVPIEEDDTLGSLYFGKIFPLGVAGLVEAAEMVAAGRGAAVAQHEARASYEGIIREAESQIHWACHLDIVWNLIRGCNPQPGAWTLCEGKRLFVYDGAKQVARTFAEVRGRRSGEVTGETERGLLVHVPGGFIEVQRVRWEDGKKIPAREAGIAVGTILGV